MDSPVFAFGAFTGLILLHGLDEFVLRHAGDGGVVFVSLAVVTVAIGAGFRLGFTGFRVSGLGRACQHQTSAKQQQGGHLVHCSLLSISLWAPTLVGLGANLRLREAGTRHYFADMFFLASGFESVFSKLRAKSII
jgi:hypothetical protein